MGIRFKLLLTFVLSFGLLAVVSLALLRRSLDASYEAIERRELASHMGRIVQSIESELGHLNSLTLDWAVWSEMYRYANHPDPAWARENIGPHALDTAGLSLVMVYDRQGQLLSFNTNAKLTLQAGVTSPLSLLGSSPYIGLITDAAGRPSCGLMKTQAGLMLSCWAHIKRSDSGGDFSGSVVMGRLFDDAMLAKLSRQTALPFKLLDRSEADADMHVWPGFLPGSLIGPGDVWSALEPRIYHLALPAQDLLKQNVAVLTLAVSRDVHEQGLLLYSQIRAQLIWAAIVIAMLLAAAVHLLLVRRLRRFTRELADLTVAQTWHSRIKVGGEDELGSLSEHVNHLLGLIETQVQSLQGLICTDAMTGLTNRRGFDERLAKALANQRRGGVRLALLVLDVDYFKRYNDSYGHPAGDAALKQVAQLLRSTLGRAADMAARIGGEEFALLLPDTDAEGALAVAQRIRTQLHQLALAHADSPIAAIVTTSIGIALAHATEETPAALLDRADRALYRAKDTGRDRAVVAE